MAAFTQFNPFISGLLELQLCARLSPLVLLSDLLANGAGSGGGGDAREGRQLLPNLTHLTSGCDAGPYERVMSDCELTPFSALRSLTHLRLLDNRISTEQFRDSYSH